MRIFCVDRVAGGKACKDDRYVCIISIHPTLSAMIKRISVNIQQESLAMTRRSAISRSTIPRDTHYNVSGTIYISIVCFATPLSRICLFSLAGLDVRGLGSF